MRIGYANIPAQVSKPVSPSAAGKPQSHPQIQAERERYSQPPSGEQIIEAEYVEFAPPSPAQLNRERQVLDHTLAPEQYGHRGAPSRSVHLQASNIPYQQGAAAPPPPGTYVDYYA